MVVVSGGTLMVRALGCAAVGGGGLYAVLRWCNGGEDFPSISNSTISFAQWEHKDRTDLIGLNFDFNSGGVIFEIGMLLILGLIVMLCFCCSFSHCCEKPQWLKDRKEKKKQLRRAKVEKKRRKKATEEELEVERKERKEY